MVFISKARMQGGHNKLQQCKYVPYKVVRKINVNAYVIDLPVWMEISKTFNVVDITLFQPDMSLGYSENHSRSSSLQVEVNDEDTTHYYVFDQHTRVVDTRDGQQQTQLDDMPVSHCASDGSGGHASVATRV